MRQAALSLTNWSAAGWDPRAGVSAAQRVGEVARHLQIDYLLDRLPSQISGGQQQRAALGRAIITPSQAFLLDEPLSNLDAKLRLEARAFLKRLQRELKSTTVYVTHDQAEAMALADRVAVMHDGVVVQVGTAREVYFRPATSFVASFIGSPPMNLVPCRVAGEGAGARIVGTGLEARLAAVFPRIEGPIRDGDEEELGVRPEHLRFTDGRGGNPHRRRDLHDRADGLRDHRDLQRRRRTRDGPSLWR